MQRREMPAQGIRAQLVTDQPVAQLAGQALHGEGQCLFVGDPFQQVQLAGEGFAWRDERAGVAPRLPTRRSR